MMNDQIKSDLIVCAVESGSNYWYLFDKEATEQVRKYQGVMHPQNEYGCFSEAVFVALDKGETIPVHDISNSGELLGKINKDSLNKAVNLLHDQYPHVYARVVTENYDANDADIFFQLAVMGDVVFG